MSANTTDKKLQALTIFGESLGLAFQVIDDILDVTQTSEKLGKSAGKDQAVGKATYPAIIGLDASRKEASRLTKLRYEAGLVSFFEVIDAQREHLTEQRALVQTKAARQQATVQLIQALGGGWKS